MKRYMIMWHYEDEPLLLKVYISRAENEEEARKEVLALEDARVIEGQPRSKVIIDSIKEELNNEY